MRLQFCQIRAHPLRVMCHGCWGCWESLGPPLCFDATIMVGRRLFHLETRPVVSVVDFQMRWFVPRLKSPCLLHTKPDKTRKEDSRDAQETQETQETQERLLVDSHKHKVCVCVAAARESLPRNSQQTIDESQHALLAVDMPFETKKTLLK
jgi:hypothetical protein